MSTTYVYTVTTTEELGTQADNDIQIGQRPFNVLRKIGNYFHGVANGSKVGTIDVQVNGGSAAAAHGTLTPTSVVSTNTFAINGTTFTAEQEMARGTATATSVIAGNIVTLAGVAFTCVASGATGNQFNVGVDDTTTCANLAAAVNASASAAVAGIVTATSAAAVVTFRAVASGTGGNAITLARTGAPWAVSGATLSGGSATSNNKFDYGDTNAQAAAEMARAVNASSSALISGVVGAVASPTLITVTATTKGTAANAITLAGSANIAASVTRLAGGTNATANSITF